MTTTHESITIMGTGRECITTTLRTVTRLARIVDNVGEALEVQTEFVRDLSIADVTSRRKELTKAAKK